MTLDAAAPPEQLAELSDTILEVTRVMSEITTRTLSQQEELTVLQFRALAVLAASSTSRVAALAEALRVSPSTATRLCDRLVAKGLIRRNRSIEDRREVQVELANSGRYLVDEVTRQRLLAIRTILDRVDPGYYAAMRLSFEAFATASQVLHAPELVKATVSCQ